MHKWIFPLLFALSSNAEALELLVGDILLQPRSCHSCTLIEEQEESIYSHMGMVIQVEPTVLVIDALGTVKTSELSDFDAETQKDQKLSVRRFRNQDAVQFIQLNKEAFVKYYQVEFEGLKYDHDFLWDNFDETGVEKMYCSELISKLLLGFIGIEVPVKRMKFDKNRDQWILYFRGNPPDGKWGNSPATFEKSDLFYEVGEL